MAKRSPLKAPCACTSGATYGACCRPFHDGAEAGTPEALMRSRFSAFAIGHGEHLVRTLHPEHPLRARPRDEVVRELSTAHHTLRYRRLEVHDARTEGARGWVLFTAYVFDRGRPRTFSELSEFAIDGGGWRYLDGVLCAGELAPDARTIDGFGATATDRAQASD